jgi:hypothetical protein
MLVFAGMIVDSAVKAGMKVPEDPDDFDAEQFPHFHAFCNVQLGYRMPNLHCHWGNAEIIAAIPEDKIKTITVKELLELGFQG